MRVEFKELAALQALTNQEINELEALLIKAYQTETELVKAFYKSETIQRYLKIVQSVKNDPKQEPLVLNQMVHKQYQTLYVQEYVKSLERKGTLHTRIKLCRLVKKEQEQCFIKSMKMESMKKLLTAKSSKLHPVKTEPTKTQTMKKTLTTP